MTFKYPSAPAHSLNILQDVNLKLESHQVTAVVGPKGSGKSAILRLINRIYDPSAGDIVIGTFDNLKSVDLNALRHTVTYLDSQSQLLAGSIKDNL